MGVFQILASVIILFMCIYSLKNIEINMITIIKYMIVTFTLTLIITYANVLLANISMLVIIGVLIYKHIKSVKKVVFTILYITLISTIATYIVGYVLQKNAVEIDSGWGIIIASYLLLGSISIVLVKLFNKYIIVSDIEFKKGNNYLISIFILLTTFLLYIYLTFIFSSLQSDAVNAEIYTKNIIFWGVVLLIVLIIILKVMARENELYIKRDELLSLQNYITETQKIYSDVRKFKHDYINIIATLSSFIEKEDISGLKTYFNNKIAPLPESMNYDMLRISIIDNIKINELRGFLMVKLIQAQEKGIKVFIEVPDEVDYINWDIVEMCRSLGILIDNAMEEAEKNQNGFVRFAMIKRINYISIIVSNSFYGETNIINKINNPDFSTKGNGRGIGLSNLRELLDANINIVQDTRIDRGEFVQVLDVRN